MWLKRTAWLLSMATLLGGCSGHSPLPLARLFHPRDPVLHGTVQKPQALQRHLDALLAADRHLEALTLIGDEIAQGHSEIHLARQYPAALNGVLQNALSLQHTNHPHQAGSLYRAARLNYPRSLTLRAHTGMTLTEIDASIELCANALLEKGLQAYRRGLLEEAITAWEAITDFHPEHVASQRATATTRTQLANLKRLAQEQ